MATLQQIADDIFSGGAQWTDHKLSGDVLTSTANVRGIDVVRTVDKQRGASYGHATYVAKIDGQDKPFRVADAAGKRIALDDGAKAPKA